MKIWLVSDGDYSDYHIIGAFSTEERANEVAKKLSAGVEEYELDEVGKDNRYSYWVRFYNDGKCEQTAHIEQSPYSTALNRVGKMEGKYTRSHYWVRVMAEDESHAIKIASDLIAQYKATKE